MNVSKIAPALRMLAHALRMLADAIEDTTEPAPEPAPEPVTLDQLREKFTVLADDHRPALLEILKDFGAKKLPDLKEADYQAVADRLKELS